MKVNGRCGRRFTPTRVGNTDDRRGRNSRFTVHPHACGEYALWLAGDRRGRLVHPHACGEYGERREPQKSCCGSPPRVWGIPALASCRCRSGRFTPTRVGNTPKPPLNGWERRFTPTRVGNTNTPTAPYTPSTVHPHACGEYSCLDRYYGRLHRFTPTRVGNTANFGAALSYNSGSPPRVWGIRAGDVRGGHRLRFTPTRVGNTSAASSAVPTSPVHPHACGEYSPAWPFIV